MPADLKQHRMEEFQRFCRGRGLPLTAQRRAVFEAMLTRQDHPTADRIYADIRFRLPGISRTTVYRILDTLVGTGMISRICHPGSAARFDPKIRRHHHLVCMHCEKIIDIESPRLDRIPWPDVGDCGFEIDDYHIHFRGTCAECRRTLQRAARRASRAGRCATETRTPARKPRGSKPKRT